MSERGAPASEDHLLGRAPLPPTQELTNAETQTSRLRDDRLHDDMSGDAGTLRTLATQLLNTHAFIHIPKTGGSTVEDIAPRNLTVYGQTGDSAVTVKARQIGAANRRRRGIWHRMCCRSF